MSDKLIDLIPSLDLNDFKSRDPKLYPDINAWDFLTEHLRELGLVKELD